MASVGRTFQTNTLPEAVFEYLADFTNTMEWDPGTRSCERVSGDGGVGTTYRNVSSFMGRTVEVTYTATELERPGRVHFVGRNAQFEGHDIFDLRPQSGGGTEVTYRADFAFSGPARLVSPVVGLLVLPLLATKTVDQLKRSLDRL